MGELFSEKEMKAVDSSPIFFYAKDNEFASFSNFTPSKFKKFGKEWPTVEHFYQAMKAGENEEWEEKIRTASSPAQAKQLGRQVPMVADFENNKYEIMLIGVRLKFSTEPFKSILLKSGNRPIYEDSPTDKIWGTGQAKAIGKGQNLLGKILMQVRKEIQTTQSEEK
jgi:ribA/ribD-fused uncharacterized protein